MNNLDTTIKNRFKHLSNKALISRANKKADFNWDDEGYELERRSKESNGNFNWEMKGDKIVEV
jgi:hypothetical protein